MNRLIISAPFGNYLDSASWLEHTTPTIGTFTLENRGGVLWRLWKVLSTVRYYPGIQAWKNKLGLPNPGIDGRYKPSITDWDWHKKRIISVSARSTEDWLALLYKTSNFTPAGIEMNVSCPNTGEIDKTNYAEVFETYVKHRSSDTTVIVKLPPIGYEKMFETAVNAGVRAFHCCNTLPIDGGRGGLSGKPLKLLSLACIKWINNLN